MSTTANSSPPMRATRSLARTVAEIRWARIASTASPAGCPWVSLIRLKSSRSISKTAPLGLNRPAKRPSIFSLKYRRFATEVRPSCLA
ncbi:MAG: hypothetical protein R2715_06765 [Ilumatobacteraceae bacterium]